MHIISPLSNTARPAASSIADIAAIIEGHTRVDGAHETAISDLHLYRVSDPSTPKISLAEPALCIIAQGRKLIMLGDEQYPYDPANYLIFSVDLPIAGQILEASREKPYLSLRLNIDPSQVGTLIDNQNVQKNKSLRSQRGLGVSPACPDLLNAVHRLLSLLNTPEHIEVMSPLIKQEIIYRLLLGEQGGQLCQIALANSQTQRVSKAIQWIKSNYAQPLSVEELAGLVNMSPSSFHHRFKAVTAISPLQFQKQLRLQEARRMLLAQDIDVATAGERVGYDSQSQFSREYSRLFGAPPLRDTERLRSIS